MSDKGTPVEPVRTPVAECLHENYVGEAERPHPDSAMANLNWRVQDYRCPDCGKVSTMEFHRTRR